MSDLKIKDVTIEVDSYDNQDVTIWYKDDSFNELEIKKNATPKEFIKHLRSMIWAIQKKVIENEND